MCKKYNENINFKNWLLLGERYQLLISLKEEPEVNTLVFLKNKFQEEKQREKYSVIKK